MCMDIIFYFGVTTHLLERLRFRFTPNGKRKFVPREQVFEFPLIAVNCLLLQLKNT